MLVFFAVLLGVFFFSYACGMFPSGPLLMRRKLRGKSLTQTGSGGTGATNVFRQTGLRDAIIVLLLDLGKGVLAIFFVQRLVEAVLASQKLSAILSVNNFNASGSYLLSLCTAVAVVGCLCGHCFPIWSHRLRGGKGVASFVGLLLMTMPELLPFVVSLWLFSLWFFGYSSLSSLLACVFVLVALAVYGSVPIMFGLALGVGIIIFRHKDNIVRLWRGAERKVYAKNFFAKKIFAKKL